MSRYIDADALKRRVGELIVPEWARTLIRTWLESAPTVDAVPVVRCKDCKHYKDGFCYNPNTYDDEKTCGNTTKDWFCADGERRTE